MYPGLMGKTHILKKKMEILKIKRIYYTNLCIPGDMKIKVRLI